MARQKKSAHDDPIEKAPAGSIEEASEVSAADVSSDDIIPDIKNMSKNAIKKRKKRIELLRSAYESFTSKGFRETTIHNISHAVGVAKGTFYLYFKDKEDVRDELILEKSSQVLTMATNALLDKVNNSDTVISVSDRFIFIVDYILDYLVADPKLLHFVAKNLSWGLVFNSGQYAKDNAEIVDIRGLVVESFRRDGIRLKDPELLIFTIIELVNATCYSTFQNQNPVTLEEYRPYLHHTIRLLVEDAVIKDAE